MAKRRNQPAPPLQRPDAAPGFSSVPGMAPSHTERVLAMTPERAQQASAIAERAAPTQQRVAASGTGNVGLRVMQASKDLGAGLLRAVAPVLPQELSVAAGDRATSMESYANTQIEGDVGLGDIDGAGSLAQFIAQMIPGSAVNMAGLANPVGLGTLATSMTGQIGQNRAESDGRDSAGIADLAIAAPVAGVSLALDRLGLDRILRPAAGTLATKMLSSAATEGGTEAAQSLLEYSGGSLGTEQGFDPATAAEQALTGALGGVGMGGGLQAVVSGTQAVSNARDQRTQRASEAEVDQQATNAAALEAFNPSPQPAIEPAQLPAPPQQIPAPEVKEPVLTPIEGDPFKPTPARATAPAPPEPAPQPAAQTSPAAAGGDGLGKAEPTSAKIAQVQPAPLRPEPGEVGEGERVVRTPAGASIRTRMEVVDASTLQQAEGDNQNRDRSRDTTDLQVQSIIANFDPEQLHEDPSSDRGAPIVGEDGAIDSGNGRMLALNKIYEGHPIREAQYRAMIEGRGFSTEGMERPVLVQRRMTEFTPEQRRQFVIDSNKDTKLELSPVERARSDADSISPEMLATYAGGDLNSTANAGFVQAFNKQLTTGEMGGMIDSNRRITPNGAQRIENALVAHAYGNPKLLERMMESSNDDIRAITGSLADVAGPWARMRAAAKDGEIDESYDITAQLADAAARVSDARKRGIKPADLLSQEDAFDRLDPVAAELIRAFHNPAMSRSASRKAVSTFLQDYIAEAQAQKATSGLLGDEPARSPLDIAKGLLEARDNPNGAGLALESKEIPNAATGTPNGTESRNPKVSRAQAADREELRSEGRNDDSRRGGSTPAVRDNRADEQARSGEDDDSVADRGTAQDAGRGYNQDTFAEASFSQRQSASVAAIRAAGFEPDAFEVLPAPRKVAILKQVAEATYGVTIEIDPSLQRDIAINQLKDMYQNLQFMAEALGIPNAAVGLGGDLSIRLAKDSKALGVFSPDEKKITLPQRSNSFAHEWAHALDWHLLERMSEGKARGITGKVRKDGAGFMPRSIDEAFVNLLNAIYFDEAAMAIKIMGIEQKIAAAKSAKAKAALQAQIDNFTHGRSRSRTAQSSFYKNAQKFEAPGEEYWTSPTEMFARAFEAWTANRVLNMGGGSAFITKDDANYLANSGARFEKTFPRGAERDRIFVAMTQLMDAINMDQVLGGPRTDAAPTMQEIDRAIDLDQRIAALPNKNIFQRQARQDRRTTMDKVRKANRPSGERSILQKLRDFHELAIEPYYQAARSAARRSGSAAATTLADHLGNIPGDRSRAIGQTIDRGIELRTTRRMNQMDKITKAHGLADLTDAELRVLTRIMTSEGGPVAGSTPALVAAAADLRKLLDGIAEDYRAVGKDIGYADNFLPRNLDTVLVNDDPEGFRDAAIAVYEDKLASDELEGDSLKEAAEAAADQWIYRMNTSADWEVQGLVPDANSEKSRALPPSADWLLADFYVQNPLERIQRYLQTSSVAIEYAQRFGPDGQIERDLIRQMGEQRVDIHDQNLIRDALSTAIGRNRTMLHPTENSMVSAIAALQNILMLTRVAITSLPEAANVGLVTSSPIDSLRGLKGFVQQVFKTGDSAQVMELLEFIGLVGSSEADDIISNRLGGTYGDSPQWRERSQVVFRTTGTAFITRMQRASVSNVIDKYLRAMAKRIVSGQGDVAEAKAVLREFGVKDPDGFAAKLFELGRRPTPADLGAEHSDFYRDYSTAVQRGLNLGQQNPNAIQRPKWANTTLGRITYGITAYATSFWTNIVIRNKRLLAADFKEGAYARGTKRAAGLATALVGVVYIAQIMATVLREELFNHERTEEWRDDDIYVRNILQLSGTRTIALGVYDVALQAFAGLKYQRDLSGMAVGPLIGMMLANGQAMLNYFNNNSSKTNTGEFNGAQALYAGVAAPLLGVALTSVGGGPLKDVLIGPALMAVTSPQAGKTAAKVAVGEKGAKTGPGEQSLGDKTSAWFKPDKKKKDE